MEGTGKLGAVVAAALARLEAELTQAAAVLLSADLLEVERHLQQVLRQVGSVVGSGVLALRAQGAEGQARVCPRCGGRLHLVGAARERAVLGLVGEYRFGRPTFTCGVCHTGHAPLDTALGLGTERLAPGLAQVLCQAAATLPFAAASASVQESLGVGVDGETIRRLAEGMGAVIEHDQADKEHWMVPTKDVPACLLVELDGVHTPLLDGYQETKVGRVAALGPARRLDPTTGRTTLVMQPSCFCATLEGTDAFFPRLTREAWRAGFTRGVRTVVCVADGAAWIWQQVRPQFSHAGVEVVEIVDYFHAVQHLAEVAKVVYGEGTLLAATWLADHKHALLHHGPAPVLAALATFTALDDPAADLVRRNRAYFTEHAARMDYPGFIARHFPIGSGAIESACKLLVTQREKQSGMRWSPPGAQHIANLRALSRSAHERWATFWTSRPLTRSRLLTAPDPARPAVPAPPPSAPPVLPPSDPAPALVPLAAPPATRIASAGKPWAKGPDCWRRRSLGHQRSA
jgi:hypothetical protein